jgi:phosphoribosylglycinamide formyltransferase-1
MVRRRLAVLLSGRGSNFEAIADAVESGRIPDAEIVAVISDVAEARGLVRARERGLPAFSVERERFARRAEHEKAILAILEAGEEESGCTVHLVDEGTDTGPVVLQKRVRIEPGDTEATLSARILEKEHEAYPEAIVQILERLGRGGNLH